MLDAPARPLPPVAEPLPGHRTWNDIFPGTMRSSQHVNVVIQRQWAAFQTSVPRLPLTARGLGLMGLTQAQNQMPTT